MTLAGLYVYGDDKVGRDAGELCGIAPVGVTATAGISDVLALGADCVLYMPRMLDLDDVCRLLESGTNVVTTCGMFHHPPSVDPAVAARVEAACRAGGTSIHSTGSSPGFISEAVPLVLASVQRRLDAIAIDEYADLSERDSPELLFELMGFGAELTEFPGHRADHLRSSFGPSLRLTADALGHPLDEVTADGEYAAAAVDTEIAAGVIKAGSIAAQRITVSGFSGARSLITFRATWYCTTELVPSWDVQDTGWNVTVRGDAPLDVALRMPVPLEQMAETSPGYTANRAVNVVHAVCAAAPGIRSTLELPPTPITLG